MPREPRLYTPEEADRLIPRLAELFPRLRDLRERIIRQQDKHDTEEITSHGLTGRLAAEAREKMNRCRSDLKALEKDFERALKFMDEAGCEIKALDPGLADFYSRRNGELVYLCWREGEEHVAYWHTLDGGFRGRQPLV